MGMGEKERMETYDIPGGVFVAKPENDETAIRSARDRAHEIVADIETYINSSIAQTLGGTCLDAEFTLGEMRQGPYAGQFNGRWCEVTFNVNVRASKEP